MNNEKLLWHGTRSTDPILIIKGAEGFDIKYSQAGLWGKGLYYAKNSNYSDLYAYKFTNGDKGIFLAKVNLGNEIELEFHEVKTR